jgi:hypothetical protein
MFNEAQVTAAEAEAAAAVRARDDAEVALTAAPYSDVAAAALTAAVQEAARKAANARELREAWEQQLAAARSAASRGELEKAAGKQITQAGREVEAAGEKVSAAATAAQAALVHLMEAAASYDGVVARHAGALAASGLDLGGETGGGRTLNGPAVRIRGRAYVGAEPGDVAVWVLHRVMAARLPRWNQLAGMLAFTPGRRRVECRTDGLLAAVPVLAKVQHPDQPRAVRAEIESAPVGRAS